MPSRRNLLDDYLSKIPKIIDEIYLMIMETAALIWFWALLLGSISLIGIGERQKLETEASIETKPEVVDAGPAWSGDASSSSRTYWIVPKN